MNVLIIDDDASVRRTLRITLESMGRRATEAANSAHLGIDPSTLYRKRKRYGL